MNELVCAILRKTKVWQYEGGEVRKRMNDLLGRRGVTNDLTHVSHGYGGL